MKTLTLTEFELYELLKKYDMAKQINSDIDAAKWFSKREFSTIKDEIELVLEEETNSIIDNDWDNIEDRLIQEISIKGK